MTVQRFRCHRLFSEDNSYTVISASDYRKAMFSYIHYQIGYIPEVIVWRLKGEMAIIDINGEHTALVCRPHL